MTIIIAEYPDTFEDGLREYLSYDPETGALRWKRRPTCSALQVEQLAGGKQGRRLCVTFRGRTLEVHRVAFFLTYGRWPAEEIDHINGNPMDNRLSNLREASRTLNRQNLRKAASNNRCGFLGVRPSGYGRWVARIVVRRRYLHLGTFDTPEAAHAAYVVAKRRLHEGCTI